MKVYAVGQFNYAGTKLRSQVEHEHGVFATEQAAQAAVDKLNQEAIDAWNEVSQRFVERAKPILKVLEMDIPSDARRIIKDKFKMEIMDAEDKEVPDYIADWVVIPLEVIE